MRVRGDEKDVIDAGASDTRPDRRHRGAGRCSAEIEADDRDALVAGGEHESTGAQRIADAERGLVLPGSVAPHGEARRRRDVHARSAGPQFLAAETAGSGSSAPVTTA